MAKNPDPTYDSKAIREAGRRALPQAMKTARAVLERFRSSKEGVTLKQGMEMISKTADRARVGKPRPKSGVTREESERIIASLPKSKFKIPKELKDK